MNYQSILELSFLFMLTLHLVLFPMYIVMCKVWNVGIYQRYIANISDIGGLQYDNTNKYVVYLLFWNFLLFFTDLLAIYRNFSIIGNFFGATSAPFNGFHSKIATIYALGQEKLSLVLIRPTSSQYKPCCCKPCINLQIELCYVSKCWCRIVMYFTL